MIESLKEPFITQVLDGQGINLPFIDGNLPFIEKVQVIANSGISIEEDGRNILTDLQDDDDKELKEPSKAHVVAKVRCKHFVCNVVADHKYNFLQDKSSAWCKPNARFHGIRCKGVCRRLFVHVKGDIEKTFKPSLKYPMYVCPNEKLRCTYAICADCRLKESRKSSEKREKIKIDEEIKNNEEVQKNEEIKKYEQVQKDNE